MIRPLIILDSLFEEGVVVSSTADIDYEVVVVMGLLEVAGNILDGVPISFFDEIRSWEGHGDDSVSDVGEVKFFSFVLDGIFGSCHNFSNHCEHT